MEEQGEKGNRTRFANSARVWLCVCLVLACLLVVSVVLPALAGNAKSPTPRPTTGPAVVQRGGGPIDIQTCKMDRHPDLAQLQKVVKCINTNSKAITQTVNRMWNCEPIVGISQYGIPPTEGYIYQYPSPASPGPETALDLDSSGSPEFWMLVWKASCGVT
jgi:hypothetical protein